MNIKKWFKDFCNIDLIFPSFFSYLNNYIACNVKDESIEKKYSVFLYCLSDHTNYI